MIRATVYTRPGCLACDAAVARLAARGYEVQRVNVGNNGDAIAYLCEHDQPLDELPRIRLWLDTAGLDELMGWRTGGPE